MLNTWTIIFLIASAQGFFIAFVLWRWRRGNTLGNRLLAALVSLFSLSMVEYVLSPTEFRRNHGNSDASIGQPRESQ